MESIGEYEYSKKDLIGHGAFAVVFKGRFKKDTSRPVAIKCITKKNISKSKNLLTKEIKILKELSSLQHEHLVGLLECKETAHHVYLVMEYCDGGDLADFLNTNKILSEDTIASFLKQIAGAMKALKNKGIVHRDLKPQNILMSRPLHYRNNHKQPNAADMILKIADFGFARFLQDGVMAATLCGSPMYMAPEVIMSMQYGAKADLWSIGTIVYQCLVGKAPFQAQTPQQLKNYYERNPTLQPAIPPGTSKELRDLLIRMLKRNSEERIGFEDFFNHPFLNIKYKSSPVPVPRPTRKVAVIGSSRPSTSPSSFNSHCSQRVSSTQNFCNSELSQPPQIVPSSLPSSRPLKKDSPRRSYTVVEGRPSSPSLDGFVLVPDNVPHSDFSDESNGSTNYSSSHDLNSIYRDNYTETGRCRPSPPDHYSPSSSPSTRHSAPNSTSAPLRRSCNSQIRSTRRPQYLPVDRQGSKCAPLPVPSQKQAYDAIKRSISNHDDVHSPQDCGQTISRASSNTSIVSIGSMSPPSVNFTIGTPPVTIQWNRKISAPVCNVTTLPPTVKSAKSHLVVKPGTISPIRRASTPANTSHPSRSSKAIPVGQSSSPIKIQTGTSPSISTMSRSPSTKIGLALAFELSSPKADSPFTNMVSISGIDSSMTDICSSEVISMNTSSISMGVAAGSLAMSGVSDIISDCHDTDSKTCRRRTISDSAGRINILAASPPIFPSSAPDAGFNSINSFASNHSLSSLEGVADFEAPPLTAEIMLNKDHNDTMNKLDFALQLVECIINIAQQRSSPLHQSANLNSSGGSTLVSFMNEQDRVKEQLSLYVRVLQLLASSLKLAKDEVCIGRLKTTNKLKKVITQMNAYYGQCLYVCKCLHDWHRRKQNNCLIGGATSAEAVSSSSSSSTTTRSLGMEDIVSEIVNCTAVDRLLYAHVMEMCQTAAADELLCGMSSECFNRYRIAQIIFHCLAQRTDDPDEQTILNKYKESVEKRMCKLYKTMGIDPECEP